MNIKRRLEGVVDRGGPFKIEVDGQFIQAYAGETIATAIMASGQRTLRWTIKRDEPRSVYCGIGICYDCLVTVDGVPNQRACMTLAKPGLVVTRQRGHSKMIGNGQ
jgi:predicted molibdopterin-dependent oxidoreductase YjgC